MNEISLNDINTFSQYFTTFLFILLRTSIIIALLPVIGGSQIPSQFKIGLAVFISILLTPVVKFNVIENQMAMLVVKEMLLGIALGLTVRFIFLAVNMGGLFISHTMGMSMGRIFNPEVGQSTHVAEVYGAMLMLFFLVADIHHDLIFVLVKSFELLPGGQINVLNLIPQMITMMGKLFVVGLKISAPIFVGILITYFLSGFLYKVAPQLNIFFIVMPLNIFLGFLLMAVSIPAFEYVIGINFSNIRDEMIRIIMIAKG
jgi:flagellar biosynthetic protein FliR